MKILALFIISLLILPGCSSPLIYPNTIDKNITIDLETNSRGSLFTSVDFLAGINNTDQACNLDYKGHIPLQAGRNPLGLEENQLTFLLINVVHRTGNSSSSFQRGALIYPRKGETYRLEVAYIDELLDMNLYKVNNSTLQPMDILPMDACSVFKQQ